MVQLIEKHFLIIVIAPLLLLLIAVSYYRFMVIEDYVVSYEGTCDELTESCFAECEDEECSSEYYFTIVERHALTIDNLCGENILDCEAANYCQEREENCSVTYCDPGSESVCEVINNSDL